jgi:hypothetical protein
MGSHAQSFGADWPQTLTIPISPSQAWIKGMSHYAQPLRFSFKTQLPSKW